MTPLGDGYEPAMWIGGYALGGPLLERGRECFRQHVFRGGDISRPGDEECNKAPVAFACYALDSPARLVAVHGGRYCWVSMIGRTSMVP
jgi:hypothetical protein